MVIKDIETIILDVPFHEVAQRNMARTLSGWHIVEFCRVTTDTGLVGVGETLPHYTWCRVTGETKERVIGQNPFSLLWDDSIGAGLQMALFDICGRAEGVPAYRLMGTKVRDHCPLSWWAIDMPPEDYAFEAREAVAQGYTAFKQKPRPWFDVYEQVRQTAEQVDENFKIDLDFNGHLNNASIAVPKLKELEQCPNIAFFETPIPQNDVEGNRRIRQQVHSAIAMHFGNPPIATVVKEECCDGFVVSGGAATCLRQFHIASEFNMPGWLQLVGTGITTTWAMHLGAVCSHATWPAITCMNMYVDQLIANPIEVQGGYVAAPEGHGLGITFNEEALKYQVESIEKPNLKALYALNRANGDQIWFSGEMGYGGYRTQSQRGNVPICEHGVRLEQWDDDGSEEWNELDAKVREGPVWHRRERTGRQRIRKSV